MRFVVCLALIGLSSLAHADNNFEFNLERGPYGVGVRVLQQYDYSRVYKTRFDLMTGQPVQGERARPMQALVWYPTRQAGAAVTYSDYIRTLASEEEFPLSPQKVEQRTEAWGAKYSARMGKEFVQQELRRKMWAIRDAKPAPGKYPLVVYAPSLGAPALENADMCEFLASQGYVVIASPSMGTRSRPMTNDAEGLETQAGDVRFLIASAHAMPQVDTAHIAVVGFSWGGLANIYAAARDDRIGALVSLDGSVRSYPKFTDGGPDAAKYVTPARVAIPLLSIGSRSKTIEELSGSEDARYSFINNMKYSDVYLAGMQPMIHRDFSSYAYRVVPADPESAYSRQEASTAYSWTARYVHQFLDAYLKGSAPALAFLQKSATANGSPRHMMTLEQRPAKATPPTFENLTLQLNTKGYEHAVAVYRKMQQVDPTFQVSERSMDEWGSELFQTGRGKEALEIFALGVTVYPESASLFESLAQVQEARGDKKLAIQNFRRSLELDGGNSNVVRQLKQLEGQQ